MMLGVCFYISTVVYVLHSRIGSRIWHPTELFNLAFGSFTGTAGDGDGGFAGTHDTADPSQFSHQDL